MSLTQKLILFSLLLVTGTSSIVLTICTTRNGEVMRTQLKTSSHRQASQIVDTLDLDLVQNRTESAEVRGRVLTALHRILARSPDRQAIYSVVAQGRRSVLVQEARRTGEPRTFGTPVTLTHAGHRAQRTMSVQSEVDESVEPAVIRTYAPILDKTRRALGLLVTESRVPAREGLGSAVWLAAAIAVLAGLIALVILVIHISRPLERMQEQLIAKENLTHKLVRRPSDLLRELTLIVDRAHSDRERFDARIKQQDRQQESSIRRRDEVIANSVHELRTPLTSIIASLEILMDSDDAMTPEEQCEFMNQASTASRHMMFIVNDMLDAAALEAGQIAVEIDHCNLSQMMSDAKRSMEIVATARRMSLVVEPIDPALEVLADAPRLMQVIFNLVSNAVKYTPSDTTITLRGWTSLNSVIVEVEDQGTAIPVDQRNRLFTKFSPLKQEDQSERVDSTGIGLYLAKKLIEMMRGTIGYRPADSGGSVFWFTLPIASDRPGLSSTIGHHRASSAAQH